MEPLKIRQGLRDSSLTILVIAALADLLSYSTEIKKLLDLLFSAILSWLPILYDSGLTTAVREIEFFLIVFLILENRPNLREYQTLTESFILAFTILIPVCLKYIVGSVPLFVFVSIAAFVLMFYAFGEDLDVAVTESSFYTAYAIIATYLISALQTISPIPQLLIIVLLGYHLCAVWFLDEANKITELEEDLISSMKLAFYDTKYYAVILLGIFIILMSSYMQPPARFVTYFLVHRTPDLSGIMVSIGIIYFYVYLVFIGSFVVFIIRRMRFLTETDERTSNERPDRLYGFAVIPTLGAISAQVLQRTIVDSGLPLPMTEIAFYGFTFFISIVSMVVSIPVLRKKMSLTSSRFPLMESPEYDAHTLIIVGSIFLIQLLVISGTQGFAQIYLIHYVLILALVISLKLPAFFSRYATSLVMVVSVFFISVEINPTRQPFFVEHTHNLLFIGLVGFVSVWINRSKSISQGKSR